MNAISGFPISPGSADHKLAEVGKQYVF